MTQRIATPEEGLPRKRFYGLLAMTRRELQEQWRRRGLAMRHLVVGGLLFILLCYSAILGFSGADDHSLLPPSILLIIVFAALLFALHIAPVIAWSIARDSEETPPAGRHGAVILGGIWLASLIPLLIPIAGALACVPVLVRWPSSSASDILWLIVFTAVVIIAVSAVAIFAAAFACSAQHASAITLGILAGIILSLILIMHSSTWGIVFFAFPTVLAPTMLAAGAILCVVRKFPGFVSPHDRDFAVTVHIAVFLTISALTFYMIQHFAYDIDSALGPLAVSALAAYPLLLFLLAVRRMERRQAGGHIMPGGWWAVMYMEMLRQRRQLRVWWRILLYVAFVVTLLVWLYSVAFLAPYNGSIFGLLYPYISFGLYSIYRVAMLPEYLLMLFCTVQVLPPAAGAVARERESGTLEMLLQTPLRSSPIMAGKLLAALAPVGIVMLPALVFVSLMLAVSEESLQHVTVEGLLLLLKVLSVGVIALYASTAFRSGTRALGAAAAAVGVLYLLPTQFFFFFFFMPFNPYLIYDSSTGFLLRDGIMYLPAGLLLLGVWVGELFRWLYSILTSENVSLLVKVLIRAALFVVITPALVWFAAMWYGYDLINSSLTLPVLRFLHFALPALVSLTLFPLAVRRLNRMRRVA
jgi:ABC-type transport system involved in multi-copper enzyme maturation permease subunit